MQNFIWLTPIIKKLAHYAVLRHFGGILTSPPGGQNHFFFNFFFKTLFLCPSRVKKWQNPKSPFLDPKQSQSLS